MKIQRNSLTDELNGFQQTDCSINKRQYNPLIIHYDEIIKKQSHLIQNLYKECMSLRQKLNRIKSQQKFALINPNISIENMKQFTQIIQFQILKQLGQILDIQVKQITKNKVIQSIKRLKWQKQKRSEPIFIESIKQVRIPVPVQKIVQKPVQKQIIKYVQKIVQKIIQKPIIQQKIVQVPVFRQKIVQKLILKVQKNQQVIEKQPQKKLEQFKKNVIDIDSIKLQENNKKQKKNQDYTKKLTLNSLRQEGLIKNMNIRNQQKQSNKIQHFKSQGNRNRIKSPRFYRGQGSKIYDQSFSYGLSYNRQQFQRPNNQNNKNYEDNNRKMIYSSRNNNNNNNRNQNQNRERDRDYEEQDSRLDRSFYCYNNEQNKAVYFQGNNRYLKRRDKNNYYNN